MSQELKSWVAEGLLTPEQEQNIRARYEQTPLARSWGMILFSSIGAVGIGLGLILLFAYNWDAIPKIVKLLLIYGAVIMAHAIGIRLYTRSKKFRAIGEACCVLGTMFFGAAIWLVAQIYHIQEHFPNGLLLWSIGALLMTWAMPSVVHGLLSAVLITLWCGFEAAEFETATHMAPLLILVGVALPAWRMRSQVMMGAALSAFLVCLGFIVTTVCYHEEVMTFVVLLNVAAIFIAFSIAGDAQKEPLNLPA